MGKMDIPKKLIIEAKIKKWLGNSFIASSLEVLAHAIIVDILLISVLNQTNSIKTFLASITIYFVYEHISGDIKEIMRNKK